jgi:hypothetical protein
MEGLLHIKDPAPKISGDTEQVNSDFSLDPNYFTKLGFVACFIASERMKWIYRLL